MMWAHRVDTVRQGFSESTHVRLRLGKFPKTAPQPCEPRARRREKA